MQIRLPFRVTWFFLSGQHGLVTCVYAENGREIAHIIVCDSLQDRDFVMELEVGETVSSSYIL